MTAPLIDHNEVITMLGFDPEKIVNPRRKVLAMYRRGCISGIRQFGQIMFVRSSVEDYIRAAATKKGPDRRKRRRPVGRCAE
jgi:hypothetical protein